MPFWSPATLGYTGLGLLHIYIPEHNQRPRGVFSPEANIQLVARLGNKPLD